MFKLVVEGGISADETIVTNARHYDALRSVASSLDDIIPWLGFWFARRFAGAGY